MSDLRAANVDGAKHTGAIFKLLVGRLRAAWPVVRIGLRGEMEYGVKACQLSLFADRTSCHRWCPCQFRLLIASLGNVLMKHIGRTALSGTEMANANANTIRVKLLRLGAVIVRNTRRVRFLFASAFLPRELFVPAAQRLNSPQPKSSSTLARRPSQGLGVVCCEISG